MEHDKPQESMPNGSSPLPCTEHLLVAPIVVCAAQTEATCSTRGNTERSSFLKLPAELRNRIYELIFTGNTIHIASRHTNLVNWHGDPNPRSNIINLNDHYSFRSGYVELNHVICQFPDHEVDMHARTVRGSNAGDPVSIATETYIDMHKGCKEESDRLSLALRAIRKVDDIASRRVRAEHHQLPMQFFWTCRQIWNETREMIYSDNTFSFHQVPDLDLFLRILRPEQRRLVHSIDLNILGSVTKNQFETLADLSNEGYMSGMTSFSLTIVHDTELPEVTYNPFYHSSPKRVRVLFAKHSVELRPEAERFEQILLGLVNWKPRPQAYWEHIV